jgi:hypothetical protein
MTTIADFSDHELWVTETTLRERYGEAPSIERAESEIRLRRADRELAVCPVLFWQVGDCNFVVAKTGDRRYRCQFFYRVHQQYGTGVDEYDDLAECVVSLLQAQADHERQQQQEQQ